MFIGTDDEGHDRDVVPAGWHAVAVREAFEKFNQSQDPLALARIPPLFPAK